MESRRARLQLWVTTAFREFRTSPDHPTRPPTGPLPVTNPFSRMRRGGSVSGAAYLTGVAAEATEAASNFGC